MQLFFSQRGSGAGTISVATGAQGPLDLCHVLAEAWYRAESAESVMGELQEAGEPGSCPLHQHRQHGDVLPHLSPKPCFLPMSPHLVQDLV